MSAVASEHPNARRMRDVAEAVARGDLDAAFAQFPEEVVWYSAVAPRGERLYRGRDGLARFFAELYERSNGTMHPEVPDVLASDDHVVIFLSITARRDDEELDAVVAHFATVGPSGFTRNWYVPDDAATWARFFG